MKLVAVFAAVVVAISAVTDLEQWEQFKKTHNKTYKNILEERTRFRIFKNTLRDIEEHNIRYNKGEETYYKGINQFSDLTSEEFRNKYLTFKIPTHLSNKKFVRDPNFIAPESLDWREKGAVLGVKNQYTCGSCWAFGATGALEGQSILKLNQNVSLSEQELVDCSSSYGNAGCESGYMEYAFEYVRDHGIATEQDYPYVANNGTCQSSNRSAVKVTDYVELDPTEDALLEGVATVGPIAIALRGDVLQSYMGGIFYDNDCPAKFNHAVLVVGYGKEIAPYWIIKNSWGIYWGEDGYFRFYRNAKQCGIGEWSLYPIVA